jgi:hypothetical protein
VRLQAKENRALYKNTLDATLQLLKSEGVVALYRGLEAQMWRNGVWNGTYFASIAKIKSLLPASSSEGGELLVSCGAHKKHCSNVEKRLLCVSIAQLYGRLSGRHAGDVAQHAVRRRQVAHAERRRRVARLSMDVAVVAAHCTRRGRRRAVSRLCAEDSAAGSGRRRNADRVRQGVGVDDLIGLPLSFCVSVRGRM